MQSPYDSSLENKLMTVANTIKHYYLSLKSPYTVHMDSAVVCECCGKTNKKVFEFKNSKFKAPNVSPDLKICVDCTWAIVNQTTYGSKSEHFAKRLIGHGITLDSFNYINVSSAIRAIADSLYDLVVHLGSVGELKDFQSTINFIYSKAKNKEANAYKHVAPMLLILNRVNSGEDIFVSHAPINQISKPDILSLVSFHTPYYGQNVVPTSLAVLFKGRDLNQNELHDLFTLLVERISRTDVKARKYRVRN